MLTGDGSAPGEPDTAATAADLRRRNVTRVARALYRQGSATRADLGRLTGLARPTVRAVVARLDEAGMVLRMPASPADGAGRPAERLQFNPLVATVAAVRHRADRLEIHLADLAGHIVAYDNVSASSDPSELGPVIADRLTGLRGSVARAGPVRAVTVLQAGVIARRDGASVTDRRRGWFDVPLERLVAAALPDVAVTILEPGAAALLGEPGLAADVDAVFVFVDLGLVVSARVNGSLVGGAHGAAGEIGHMIVEPDGLPCTCGRTGCLETVASGRAILDRLRALPDPVDVTATRTVASLYGLGRRDVEVVVDDAARHLARAIAVVASVYDPQVIVLGGTDFLAGADAFLDAVRTTTDALRSRVAGSEIEYRLSTPDADVRGAILRARGALPDDLRAVVHD